MMYTVFSDYISNILPELGEDTIPEINAAELINRMLNNKYPFQSLFDHVEKLIENSDELFKK